TVIPKPLMPIGDKPILEIIVKQLKKNNFKEIIISTGHLAELIHAYFGDGKKWGVRIKYVYETKPLSTAGAIKLIKGLHNNFLVINGDILSNIKFKDIYKYHIQKNSAATICVKKRTATIDYGIVKIKGKDNFTDYIEKPSYSFYVSTGIYILNKACISYIRKNEVLGMPELILRLKNNNEKINCKIHDGSWLDIGRYEDYEKANELYSNSKLKKFYE
ncbi:MAG: nucleotidyltransferase family protein, partial [Elusimicrobia bacterium]|nr:nucleotidyltransferase family protein [Elusimicrobiota bacterium]